MADIARLKALKELSARKSALVRDLEFPEDWRAGFVARQRNAKRHEEIAKIDAEIVRLLTTHGETNETV